MRICRAEDHGQFVHELSVAVDDVIAGHCDAAQAADHHKRLTEVVDDKKRKSSSFCQNSSALVQVATIMRRLSPPSRLMDLPTCLVVECLTFLDIADYAVFATLCVEANNVMDLNALWRPLYHKHFGDLVTEKQALMAPSGEDEESEKQPIVADPKANYRRTFAWRLQCPIKGDKVEVAWNGKFRLENDVIYNGCAWWTAEVVTRDSETGHYLVRYPGWDTRWNEWVTRERLRWTQPTMELDENATSTSSGITRNDDIEIWCGGHNVPGAWLEARAYLIREDRVHVGPVITAGDPWIPVFRVRKCTRPRQHRGMYLEYVSWQEFWTEKREVLRERGRELKRTLSGFFNLSVRTLRRTNTMA